MYLERSLLTGPVKWRDTEGGLRSFAALSLRL